MDNNGLDIFNGKILNLQVDSNLTINGVPIEEYINNLILQYAKENTNCKEDIPTPPLSCREKSLNKKQRNNYARSTNKVYAYGTVRTRR